MKFVNQNLVSRRDKKRIGHSIIAYIMMLLLFLTLFSVKEGTYIQGDFLCYMSRLTGHGEDSKLSKYMPQAVLSLITLTFHII